MSDRSEETQPGVEVPPEALSEEALQRVIEEFVSREGTEYGGHEVSLHDKVATVHRQLHRGDAVIRFDAESGSVGIYPASSKDGSSRDRT